jgi:signal transduction histidine kinase
MFYIRKIRYDLANEMLGYVNHEIRNPLNCIKGLLEITIQDLNILPGCEVITSNLISAKNACDLLNHIVSDILDFKRMADGKLEVNKTTLETTVFLKNLYSIIKGKLSEKPKIEYKVENLNNISSFYSDYNRLVQILLNFLTNSIKFTESGTIKLIIEPWEINKIKFSVQDTGLGIPVSQYKRMFKPFGQTISVDTFRFSGIGGSGLGLYLCKMLTGFLGGEIGFSSEVNVGSTFWIILDQDDKVAV